MQNRHSYPLGYLCDQMQIVVAVWWIYALCFPLYRIYISSRVLWKCSHHTHVTTVPRTALFEFVTASLGQWIPRKSFFNLLETLSWPPLAMLVAACDWQRWTVLHSGISSVIDIRYIHAEMEIFGRKCPLLIYIFIRLYGNKYWVLWHILPDPLEYNYEISIQRCSTLRKIKLIYKPCRPFSRLPFIVPNIAHVYKKTYFLYTLTIHIKGRQL